MRDFARLGVRCDAVVESMRLGGIDETTISPAAERRWKIEPAPSNFLFGELLTRDHLETSNLQSCRFTPPPPFCGDSLTIPAYTSLLTEDLVIVFIMEVAAQTISNLPKLPPRLLRFFERYPPQLYSARVTGVTLPLTRRDAKEAKLTEAQEQSKRLPPKTKVKHSEGQTGETTVPLEPSPPQSTTTNLDATTDPISSTTPLDSAALPLSTATEPTPSTPSTTLPTGRIVDGLTRATRFPANPFLPFRNPSTGHWAGARISLRTQADLVKIAKKHRVEDLLPPGRKSTAFKDARTLQKGLRVKGTGFGERVKGHKWERAMPEMLQKRKEALEQMPALVREWQARGHGRGWKKWPKAKSK